MKLLFFVLLVLNLTNCGGSSSLDGSSKQSPKIKEFGYCSQAFLNEMNGAELSLKIYKAYGLNSGKSLIEAHSEYSAIKEKYGEISCQARDHDTGNVFTINNSTVDRYVNETYQELSQAMTSKCNSVSTTAERNGCSWIANYMKEKFGK
jgi:hypothetical protein